MKAKPIMATSASNQASVRLPVRVIGEGLCIWGMSSAERLGRMFARLDVEDVSNWDGTVPDAETCFLVSADHAFSQVLLADLAKKPGAMLTSDGRPVAAHVPAARASDAATDIAKGQLSAAADLKAYEPDELSSSYDMKLRKREAPYVMPLGQETVDAVQQRIFDGSYKGVTDFVTLYLWPKPAIAVVRGCSAAGITPNMVTSASLVLVLAAMLLFWNGYFLSGIVMAWLMTFLDTVDGKLARVTITSTRFGNIFDHGIDLIHPPFWYWAWAVGVTTSGQAPAYLDLALWVTVIGYVVQRLQEGIFIKLFTIEMHIWRRFDSLYRLVVARRNPNLVLLTVFALAGYPGEGLIAVAIWTAASLVVHSVQIWQALHAPRPITSWLDR